MNVEQTASHLGIFFNSYTVLMEKCQSALTNKERQLFPDFSRGGETPNTEHFPTIYLSPKLDDCMGLFLKTGKSLCLDFFSVTVKVL